MSGMEVILLATVMPSNSRYWRGRSCAEVIVCFGCILSGGSPACGDWGHPAGGRHIKVKTY